MSIVPAPTSTRGEIILQPAYFTSSIYVKALRDDITNLILKYYEKYSETQPAQPFSLFKELWEAQGWKLLHFKVFDDRARKAFLDVTLRLFLERTVKTEAPFSRAAALFGMYIFFSTQPRNAAPPLYSVSHIPIATDHFLSLKALPEGLITPEFEALQPRIECILSRLMKEKVFLMVPESRLGALNPRSLPREVYMDSCVRTAGEDSGGRKKGRPTKRDKAQKAKTAVESLDRWLERTSCVGPAEALEDYQRKKGGFLSRVYGTEEDTEGDRAVIAKANEIIVGRLREAQALVGSGSGSGDAGVLRVERAAASLGDGRGGVLGLVEGAGVEESDEMVD
ncbi:hypothetical protein BDQ17DRAFT_1229994 [Cyathus striatus]|nr:hypothetical protein BDQ17DRAFT_1229994 [Cyathus striatus]